MTIHSNKRSHAEIVQDDEPTSHAHTSRDHLTTESLRSLQSTDERQLLDVVDRLRRTGLSSTIELPQLVVCGDQSSGKSSVLEAITQIPFPRKAGLCTRFATEIILRRQTSTSVTVKITPSKTRTDEEKRKLSLFTRAITDLAELPAVMEAATHEMGLGKIGQSKAFSRDILSITICGPDRPQLTLVDLPGLIHSATKAQSDADKKLIHSLVDEYMKNPRSIILAVVSAKNDVANQIILDLFKKVDKKGSRTLGIITKPDCIAAEDQQTWIDLAQNKEIYLERGWHVVKNRTEKEMHFSFKERNDAEREFFANGIFKNLPRDTLGIESLCVRLSQVLYRHLTQELPALLDELRQKLCETNEELAKLGEKRETLHQQRTAIMRISTTIQAIITSAVNGHYAHSFFESIDLESRVDSGKNIRRFRAVIQDLNNTFAEDMRLFGHKYSIEGADEAMTWGDDAKSEDSYEGSDGEQDVESEADSDEELDADELKNLAEREASVETISGRGPRPIHLTFEEGVTWAKSTITRCRGRELPGGVNPEVTSHLFWEQSSPWDVIAEDHIKRVQDVCKEFVDQVLEFAAPKEFKKPLEDLSTNNVLDEGLHDAQEEFKKLLNDKERHPSTYNHYYSDILQKRRNDKYADALASAKEAATTTVTTFETDAEGVRRPPIVSTDLEVFQQEMAKTIQKDTMTFAAEESLESQHAYYKDALKVFVHNVTNQVIERCMIDPLPERLLSPMVVSDMPDEEITFIAGEPPETISQRRYLEDLKTMLESGEASFRGAMGAFKRPRMSR